jgi:hypothetical protein
MEGMRYWADLPEFQGLIDNFHSSLEFSQQVIFKCIIEKIHNLHFEQVRELEEDLYNPQ